MAVLFRTFTFEFFVLKLRTLCCKKEIHHNVCLLLMNAIN